MADADDEAAGDKPTSFRGVKLSSIKTPKDRMAYLRRLVLRTKVLSAAQFDQMVKEVRQEFPRDLPNQEMALNVKLAQDLLCTQHTRWYPFAWSILHWLDLEDAAVEAENAQDPDNPDPEVEYQIKVLVSRMQAIQPYAMIPDGFLWHLTPQPFGSNDRSSAFVSRVAKS